MIQIVEGHRQQGQDHIRL